ncbi:MAG TPA: SGNH/GDSL hydrolase family protein [Saprospiraceae bacterium]|nr:SGNH/GDSL hydrolase family protein [Saprospiraceae bacterium]
MKFTANGPGALKYLALGDSYTIGEGVESHENFPFQLTRVLRRHNFDIADPAIVATTGWTTTQLLNAVRDFSKKEDKYGFVTLLIGVNNQYQKKPMDLYRKEFAELLKIAIERAGNIPGNVVIVSIPDYGVTPFAVSKNPDQIGLEIDQYNEIGRTMALEAGAHYVNVTGISREVKNDSSYLVSDLLHPSAKQYTLWVDRIAEVVLEKILK